MAECKSTINLLNIVLCPGVIFFFTFDEPLNKPFSKPFQTLLFFCLITLDFKKENYLSFYLVATFNDPMAVR